MKNLDLRYVAAVYPITSKMSEPYETDAETMRDLIHSLDERYGGFTEMFISSETNRLSLNTMIYYGDEGKVPVGVLDIDQPISDGATITFW